MKILLSGLFLIVINAFGCSKTGEYLGKWNFSLEESNVETQCLGGTHSHLEASFAGLGITSKSIVIGEGDEGDLNVSISPIEGVTCSFQADIEDEGTIVLDKQSCSYTDAEGLSVTLEISKWNYLVSNDLLQGSAEYVYYYSGSYYDECYEIEQGKLTQ